MEKVDLYIGACMGDLNKKSVYSFDTSHSMKMHINHSEKTFQAAEEARLKGDEERSYILYMRYIDIFQKVRNSQAYKKDESHYSLLLGKSKLISAVSRAEKLSESLKQRFHQLKQSESQRSTEVKSSIKTNLAPHPCKDEVKVEEPSALLITADPLHQISVDARSISCEQFYKILFSKQAKDRRVLIIDIRKQEHFASSRIRHSDCINIPKSLIKPGVTSKRIEKGIEVEKHLVLWRLRPEMDIVVLLDWHFNMGDFDDLSNPIRSLYDALTKWEQEVFLKRNPVILIGGFSHWLDYYPQFCTDPSVKRPTIENSATKSLFGLSDFSFPDLINSLDDDSQSSSPVIQSETKPSPDTKNSAQGALTKSEENPESTTSAKSLESSTTVLSEVINGIESDSDSDSVKKEIVADRKISCHGNLTKGSVSFVTASKHSVKKSVPVVDRTTKPVQTPLNDDSDEPKSVNFQQPVTSDTDRAIAEIQSRLQVSMKKKEEEDIKARDLQEKKKLVELQVLEHRIRMEAEQKEQRRKAAERDLAEAMRALKDDKPKIQDLFPGSSDNSGNSALPPTPDQEPKDVTFSKAESDPFSDSETAGVSQVVSKPRTQEHTFVEEVDQTDSKSIKLDRFEQVLQSNHASTNVATFTKVKDGNSAENSVTAERKSGTNVKDAHLAGLSNHLKDVRLTNNRRFEQTEEHDEPGNKKDSRKFGSASVAGLPLNWEKRLDKRTGRYYYLDHNTKTTHWMLPQRVITDRKRDLKPANGGSNLKRSSSSPDIAQLVERESGKSTKKPMIPSRQVKPSLQQDYADPPDQYANKLALLHPAYGGSGPGLCGLQNLGNTCYMNSVLQCMFNTALLVQYFLSNKYRRDINRYNFLGSGGEITDGFAVLMKAAWDGRFKHLTPRVFRHTLSKFNSRFSGYSQQDSQELLLFLMDGLHEDLNLVQDRSYEEEKDNDGLRDFDAANYAWEYHKRLNKSIIVELFQGQFKATVQCTHCKKSSRKFDVFMYLSLPLPSRNCSISECIKKFSEPEMLSGDNKWRCPSCKMEREAERRMEIWKLPPVLLIHFKRFSFCGRWGDKLQTTVAFPSREFDMNEYVKGPKTKTLYELYSVSHHYGATLDSGHYVASCKSPADGNWYKFDDHEVSKAAVPQGSSAYILCYTSLPHSLNVVKS